MQPRPTRSSAASSHIVTSGAIETQAIAHDVTGGSRRSHASLSRAYDTGVSTLTPAALALGAGFVVGAAGAGWRLFRLRDDGLLPLTVALLFLGILSTIGPPFTHIINQGKAIAQPLAVLQWPGAR